MTVHEMGRKAYNDGDLREDNPFLPDDRDHSEWLRGYDSAVADNHMCDDKEEPESLEEDGYFDFDDEDEY